MQKKEIATRPSRRALSEKAVDIALHKRQWREEGCKAGRSLWSLQKESEKVPERRVTGYGNAVRAASLVTGSFGASRLQVSGLEDGW